MRRLSKSGTAAKRRKPINHGEMKPQKAATSLRLRSRESQPTTALPLDPRRHHGLRDEPQDEHEEDDRRQRVEGERQARYGSFLGAEQIRDSRQQRPVPVEQEEEVLGQVIAPDEDEGPH